MKKINLLAILALTLQTAFGQADSDIYLFDLSVKKRKVSITNPVNITKHKGYDNQPSFHPSEPIVYYSSFDNDGRADIMAYNYKTSETKAITKTTDREYSPTVTLDKHSVSCIIQRDNGAQDLGKYPIDPEPTVVVDNKTVVDGSKPTVIVDNLTVGYHVWADNSHLALFVLGTPNTLHFLRLPTKKDTIVAQNIGRSLNRMPGHGAISFVHKVSDTEWLIKKLENKSMAISTIATTLPGHEDLCWTSDGKIIMSDGTKLFFNQPGKKTGWVAVDILQGADSLKGVTRLAVSADGKKLAVVVSE